MRKGRERRPRPWRKIRPAAVYPRPGRRAGRKWLKTLVFSSMMLMASYSMLTAYPWVKDSPYFRIDRIEMEGFYVLSRQDLDPYLGIEPSETLFQVDLPSMRDRLLSHPWIKTVHVRKSFPGTLKIRVTERVPAAIVQDGDQRILVDDTGKILVDLDAMNKESLPFSIWAGKHWPTFLGIELASLQRNEPGSKQALLDAMNLVEIVGLPDSHRDSVRIDLRRSNDVVLEWNGDRIRLGRNVDPSLWNQLRMLYPEIARMKEGVKEIDLRFSNQVIVN